MSESNIIQIMLELGHTPVSYTSVKEFKSGGIHQYYRYKERELEEVSTPSTDLGSLIDEYLLNREGFDDKYLLDTTAGPNSENQRLFCELVAAGEVTISEAYKRCYKTAPKTESKLLEKAQILYEENKDYINFLPKIGEKLTYGEDTSFGLSQISMGIQGHKFLGKLFDLIKSGGTSDIEVFTHVHIETLFKGIPLHGELDIVVINHTQKTIRVYDLKSTSYHLVNFVWQVKKLQYVLQEVIYGILSKQELLPEGYTFEIPRLIAVRTQGDYGVGVYDIPKEWFKQEVKSFLETLEEIRWHYETKQFKYPREYYEGSGILELKYIKDMELWKEEIEQSIS